MNDFPDLVPPPERSLTPQQRARLRAALPQDEVRERRWLVPVVAAAAVVAVVGGGVALRRDLGDDGPTPTPNILKPQKTDALPFPAGASECLFAVHGRTEVIYSQVTPLRDVVLRSVTLENPRSARTTGAWYTAKPPGTIDIAGAFEEGLAGVSETVRNQWAARSALVGSRLEAGRTYTVFVRVTVELNGHFDGLRFGYVDGPTERSTFVAGPVAVRLKCE